MHKPMPTTFWLRARNHVIIHDIYRYRQRISLVRQGHSPRFVCQTTGLHHHDYLHIGAEIKMDDILQTTLSNEISSIKYVVF